MQNTIFKMGNLFGEESSEIVFDTNDLKKIVKKTQISDEEEEDDEVDESRASKLLKSKKVSKAEKVAIVEGRILKVLSKQKKNVIVITDKQEFHDYITKAIASGRIAIDTETNNSLDPVTCKIMGLCLYYPGGKAAYIPVNHIDIQTGLRLEDQLTEEDINKELERVIATVLLNPNFEIIMHNGKFDYEVICCTCHIKVKPTWDTMVGWRLIDENSEAGLKFLYTTLIDTAQVKYDLGGLCENIPYAWLDPKIFALYAATDSLMTDKVFELEYEIMIKPENERLYKLFREVEMPVVTITGDMEMTGVAVDQELGARLKEKYTEQLTKVDADIEKYLATLKPLVMKWRTTKDATDRSKQYEPKKSKKSRAEIEEAYPLVDKEGKRYKLGKPKTEQLPDEINLASPPQLAILFYDILKCPTVSKKSPRGTGSEELKALSKELSGDADLDEATLAALEEAGITQTKKKESDPAKKAAAELCDLILKRRGIMKLVTTYIDVIPTLAQHWPDGRIRFHLNQLGTDTGRFSSGGKLKFTEGEESVIVSGINIQNIPSHNKEIRMLFKARVEENTVDSVDDNHFVVSEITEVETTTGYKYCKDLVMGDQLVIDGQPVNLLKIGYNATTKEYLLCV